MRKYREYLKTLEMGRHLEITQLHTCIMQSEETMAQRSEVSCPRLYIHSFTHSVSHLWAKSNATVGQPPDSQTHTPQHLLLLKGQQQGPMERQGHRAMRRAMRTLDSWKTDTHVALGRWYP